MDNNNEWVAYVAPVAIPEGGAAAARILGNARALASAGFKVTIVSGHCPPGSAADLEISSSIRCVRLNERHSEHMPLALRRLSYANMGAGTAAWLSQQPILPKAVFIYSGYTPYIMNLLPWARRQSVPLIFDAVEWYTPRSLWQYLVSPYYWNIELSMRVLIPRLDGVVAISEALNKYYRTYGLPVERIPPLIDSAELKPIDEKHATDQEIQLAYSGSPGHKDLLRNVIDAVDLVNADKANFVLNVAGLSERELATFLPRSMRGGFPSFLRLVGKVDRPQAQAIVGKSDFSIFVREINRVSTFGFPTKFVESLALGTPVITNLSSDLSNHLRDNETGFICASPAPKDIASALATIASSDRTNFRLMRKAARLEAEEHFDYRQYRASITRLIDSAHNYMTRRQNRTTQC